MRSLLGSGKDQIPVPTESIDMDQAMAKVTDKMKALGFTDDVFNEESVKFALANNYSNGDPAKAVELLVLFQEATEGLLLPITHLDAKGKPRYYRLKGSDNYNGISCYVDSLLFAMFARLESFEPILYKAFDSDESRDSLALLLRFYVNMLRSGKLISTDIDKFLVDQIFTSGFTPGSSKNHQQDVSELFSFITEKLDMPLLTLRVEIAHGGKTDAKDDHKLINESLLHVPIPGSTTDLPIRLEQCLELYFSNSVEVSRQLERRRTLSLTDMTTNIRPRTASRKYSLHFETIEPSSPTGSISNTSQSFPLHSLQRGSTGIAGERRSIIITHETESANNLPDRSFPVSIITSRDRESSAGTTSIDELPAYEEIFSKESAPVLPPAKTNPLWTANNEFTLPAWMFLQLLPFYSRTRADESSAQSFENASPVARHFANARPVLGICLKRYSWTDEGEPIRNSRKVIVPKTINLPSFVADDTDDGSIFGNFQLVLESAIFHRGNSIHSGHYVALSGENSYIEYESEPSASRTSKFRSEAKSMWRSRSVKTSRGRNGRGNARSRDTVLQGLALSDDEPSLSVGSDKRYINKRWILFDNLESPGNKVVEVDFDEIFDKECPYLLFYRMISIDDNPSRTSSQQSRTPPSSGTSGNNPVTDDPELIKPPSGEPLLLSPSSISVPGIDEVPLRSLDRQGTLELDLSLQRRSFDGFRRTAADLFSSSSRSHSPSRKSAVSAQLSRSPSPFRKSTNSGNKAKQKGTKEERDDEEKCVVM